MVAGAAHDTGVHLVTKRWDRGIRGVSNAYREQTLTSTHTTMSHALAIPDVAPSRPAHPPYRLADSELRLRSQFVAAFTDAPQSAWELHTAAWDLTDELKSKGELAEEVVKRIKYIAAIPISFHYRAGYKTAHAHLIEAVDRAISISIARYFAEDGGRKTRALAGDP